MPYIDGLVQDCSNSIANALELLQSCTKPLLWGMYHVHCFGFCNYLHEYLNKNNKCIFIVAMMILNFKLQLWESILMKLNYETVSMNKQLLYDLRDVFMFLNLDMLNNVWQVIYSQLVVMSGSIHQWFWRATQVPHVWQKHYAQ